MGKLEVLIKLVEGENVMGIEGFLQYKNTERWAKLRTII